jgi:hypothetical protein
MNLNIHFTYYDVWSGHYGPSGFVKETLVYSSESLADCYAWLEAKKKGYLL